VNVFGNGAMTVKALAAALLSLPDDSTVERVVRDDNEMAIALGMESTTYERDPIIEIRIRLPKHTVTRKY
jgi:hypothetical protein